MNTLIRLLVAILAMAIGIYAAYLRFTAAPPFMTGAPVTNLVVAAAVLMLIAVVFLEFRQSQAPIPRPVFEDTPQTPASLDRSQRQSFFWPVLILPLLIAAPFYIQHATWADEKTLWIDRYAGFILPALATASAVWWLADTFAAPLINGMHTHKPTQLRVQLVLKRTAVLALAFAVLLTLNQHEMQAAYREPAYQLMLSGIMACVCSVILIRR